MSSFLPQEFVTKAKVRQDNSENIYSDKQETCD